MKRFSLASLCVAVLVTAFGCQSEIGTPPSQSPAAEVDTAIDNDIPSDVNWIEIEQRRHIIERTLVLSKYETFDGCRVLHFNNHLVTISVSLQDVIGYFDEHFAQYPNLKDEKLLSDRLRDKGTTCLEYRFKDFSRREQDRLHFCLATLLQQGIFRITLNSTGEVVTEIFACEYSWVRGPLDADGGRVFFLKDGRQFFHTMDWIS